MRISNKVIKRTVFVILGILAMFYLYSTRIYRGYQAISSTSNTEGNVAKYISLNGGFVKYTRDGASYLKTAKTKTASWTENYSMSDPEAVQSGNYVAIADLNGNEVCIFNQSGKVNSITMPYPIIDIEMASQGVVAVILQGENESYVKMYTKEGSLIADIKSKIRKNGYPMDISISSDAKKMVISYFSIEGDGIKNKISFYDFSEENKSDSSNLVGEDNQKSNLVSKVKFMDDETVYAIGDEKTIIYSFTDEVEKDKTINFSGEIQSIAADGNYIGYIQKSSTGKEDYNSYIISLYNKHGMKLYSRADYGYYDELKLNGRELIAIKGSQLYIFNEYGWRYYAGEFENDIEDVVYTGNKNEYMLIFADETQIIRIG